MPIRLDEEEALQPDIHVNIWATPVDDTLNLPNFLAVSDATVEDIRRDVQFHTLNQQRLRSPPRLTRELSQDLFRRRLSISSIVTEVWNPAPIPELEPNPAPHIPIHFSNLPHSYRLPAGHRDVEIFQRVLPQITQMITDTVTYPGRPKKAIRCLRRGSGVSRAQQPCLPVVIIFLMTPDQATKRVWMNYEPQVRALLVDAYPVNKCPPIRYYIKQPRTQPRVGRSAYRPTYSEFSGPGSDDGPPGPQHEYVGPEFAFNFGDPSDHMLEDWNVPNAEIAGDDGVLATGQVRSMNDMSGDIEVNEDVWALDVPGMGPFTFGYTHMFMTPDRIGNVDDMVMDVEGVGSTRSGAFANLEGMDIDWDFLNAAVAPLSDEHDTIE